MKNLGSTSNRHGPGSPYEKMNHSYYSFLFLLSNPACFKTLGSAMIIYVSFVFFFVPFLASTHNCSAILIYASVVSFVVNRCFSDLFI